MSTYKIKTHSSKNKISKPHFFILNKGLNSGKPLKNPCPNCYILSAETEEEKEFYYWLIFGLWQSKAFYPFIIGSVIPFIRIGEFKKCVQSGANEASANIAQFKKSIKALQLLQQQEELYKQNLILIKQAKQAIFLKYKRKR